MLWLHGESLPLGRWAGESHYPRDFVDVSGEHWSWKSQRIKSRNDDSVCLILSLTRNLLSVWLGLWLGFLYSFAKRIWTTRRGLHLLPQSHLPILNTFPFMNETSLSLSKFSLPQGSWTLSAPAPSRASVHHFFSWIISFLADFPTDTLIMLCCILPKNRFLLNTCVPWTTDQVLCSSLWLNSSKGLSLLISTSFSHLFSWTHYNQVSFSFITQRWGQNKNLLLSRSPKARVMICLIFFRLVFIVPVVPIQLCLLSWHILIIENVFLHSQKFSDLGKNCTITLPIEGLCVPNSKVNFHFYSP